LLLDEATGIGGENLFVFSKPQNREKAALKFAEFVLVRNFRPVGNWHGLSAGESFLARQSDKYQAFVAEQPAVKGVSGMGDRVLFSPAWLSESLGRAIGRCCSAESSWSRR